MNVFLMTKSFNILVYSITPGYLFFLTIFAIVTFTLDSVEHNLLFLLINCFGIFILFRHITYIALTMMLSAYMAVEYIKFRLQTIIDIIGANTLMLTKAIFQYDVTSRILKKLAKTVNIIISFIYLFFPIYYVSSVNIAFNINTSLIGLIALILTLLLNLFLNYIVFEKLSSISITNICILEHLYPILTDKNFQNFRLRLNIDSFIARINNTEFIGFRCLHYIKFERKAFYSYMIGLSSTYFLVYNILTF